MIQTTTPQEKYINVYEHFQNAELCSVTAFVETCFQTVIGKF